MKERNSRYNFIEIGFSSCPVILMLKTNNGGRRFLGPPLLQVDSQPLRSPLGPEEERKVSRWLSVAAKGVKKWQGGWFEQRSGSSEHSKWLLVRSERLRDWPTGYRHAVHRYTLEYKHKLCWFYWAIKETDLGGPIGIWPIATNWPRRHWRAASSARPSYHPPLSRQPC